MAARYNLRNATGVANILQSKETVPAYDLPSDDEEDGEEPMSDSESEQSEIESDSEVPDKVEPDLEEELQEDEPHHQRKKSRTSSVKTPQRGRRPSLIRGKDGHRWSIESQERITNKRTSIPTYLPTPIGEALNAKTPIGAWSLLFPDCILQKIMIHTNEEIARYRNSMETEDVRSYTYSDIDLIELKAFIGIIYLSGLQKTTNTNLIDLWSHDYGSTLYRATMSNTRFKFLLGRIRFDDKATRSGRKETDKFAPIREVWEIFQANCTEYYKPGTCCTIDEQLLSFRGRCPFKIYNGAKPDECGIKIVMLNDSRTFYMYTAEPYVGIDAKDGGKTVPSYYIRKLSQPLHGTSRNITCDNWFSSCEIFDEMLAEHNITMVGTLGKNKRQIPEDFRKAGPISSSKFAFDETKTLVSYTPKKDKIVLLLSNLHHTTDINEESNKPEIIEFYNSTKGGTDTFDQMCQEYTTARKTMRWPMRVWWGMLDQGRINASILYNLNIKNQELDRRSFIKSLIRGLIDPHLRVRYQIPNLRRNLRFAIEELCNMDPIVAPYNQSRQSKRCTFCPREKDRKTRMNCEMCNRSVCEDHRVLLCQLCHSRD